MDFDGYKEELREGLNAQKKLLSKLIMDQDSPPTYHKIRLQKRIEAIQKEIASYGKGPKAKGSDDDNDDKLLDELGDVSDDEESEGS